MARITVPPLPDKLTGWRKTVGALTDASGGFAVQGEWLTPGDVADIPDGTLIIAVDKKYLGHTFAGRYSAGGPQYSATVTLSLVAADGLTELWTRSYKSAASALGAATRTQITKHLGAHPAPAGPVAVITAARRPNREAGECRWCGGRVLAQTGHLVGHGDDLRIEHWETCPGREIWAEPGVACTLCGVVLVAEGGYRAPDRFERVMVREGEGRWEPRHAARLNCTTTRLESGEEYRARQIAAREAETAAAQSQREADQKKAARKAAKVQQARDAADAEEARVEGLTVTKRTPKNVNDKDLGGGERAALDEVTLTLSDGTTATRWEVRRYYPGTPGSFTVDGDWGGDEPDETVGTYYLKTDARSAYKALKWTAPAREPYERGGMCDECHGGGARYTRYDSSGIKGTVCSRCNREPDYILSFA